MKTTRTTHVSIIKFFAIGSLLLPLVSANALVRRVMSMPNADSATATAGSDTAGAAQTPATSAGESNPQTSPSPQTHFAPTAPIHSSMPPVSVEENIRDIRSPRHPPNPLLWAMYAVGALALGVGGFGVWLWRCRNQLFEKLPYEIALDQLEEARRFMTPGHAQEFSVAVSEIIHHYIEQRFEFRVSHRSSEEQLRELLVAKQALLAGHRELLGEFLSHYDAAKLLHWKLSRPEMEAMHAVARTFVLRAAIGPMATEKPRNALPLVKSARVHLDPPAAPDVHTTPKPA